jgi:hypothetical protein
MSAICVTFGEQSENHYGMTKNGNGLAEHGYSLDDLTDIMLYCQEKGIQHELISLHDMELTESIDLEESYVLYIKNGVNKLIGNRATRKLFTELATLDWDTQFWDTRRSKVLNKHARYNLCFANEYQDADFENKQGTMISYDMVPLLNKLRDEIMLMTNESELQVEGNYYYDLLKTGIGYHGDAERKKVIGVNLSDGNVREIHWKWYLNSKPISEPYKLELSSGDMYIMSEYSTGYNWKKRSIPTLRHAAGIDSSKYLK